MSFLRVALEAWGVMMLLVVVPLVILAFFSAGEDRPDIGE